MDGRIYTRYSTDNQTENSTQTQIQKCKEYAERKGITITGVYSDEAVSGMKMERSGLQQLLEDASRKEFHAIIIYDQSRLSRDIVDWFTLRNALDRLDIELYSVMSDKFGDVQDPSTFMLESVQAVFNQMHVLTTRRKTIDGMRNIAMKGGYTGGKPCLGYDVVNKCYEINEAEAELVRTIFLMYADGKSYNQIIDYMNYFGHKTKAGRSFGKNSLYSILGNEKYIGNLIYGKVNRKNGKRNTHSTSDQLIRLEGAVPAIIEKELWDVVQVHVKSRQMNTKGGRKVEYLLAGKIFCGECGFAMCGKGQRKQYFYYGCSGASRLHNCSNCLVRKDKIEEAVCKKIRDFLSGDNLNQLAQNLYDSMQVTQNTSNPIKSALEKRIKEVQRQIENINNAIADGIYSSTTKQKLNNLENQERELYAKLSETQKIKVETKKSLSEIKSVLEYALNHADSNKLLIKLMVERVTCYKNKKVHVILNPLGIENCVPKLGAANRT